MKYRITFEVEATHHEHVEELAADMATDGELSATVQVTDYKIECMERKGKIWHVALVNNRALFYGDVRIANRLFRAGFENLNAVALAIIDRGLVWGGTDKGYIIGGTLIRDFGRKSSFSMLEYLQEQGFNWREHVTVPRPGGKL